MKAILTFFLCIGISVLHAQNKSNKGKEFWVGYGYSWIFDHETNQNTQDFVMYLSAEAPAIVTVSVANTSWSQTVNIPANTVNASVIIPKSGVNDARIFSEGLHNKAIHIVSDTPIVVYAHMYNGLISTATMLMPVETFGYKNYSLNYSQSTSTTSLPHPPTSTSTINVDGWYSFFFAVASEDNTRLEITPSDTTVNGWLPNTTHIVNLNKGELYNVFGKRGSGSQMWECSKDMSGSKVVSIAGADGICHPVAMFSGSSGIRLCKNDGGENMLQQVFPAQAWGTKYVTYHTLNNFNVDMIDPFKNFYRIAVTDPTTVVKRNGIVMTGLQNNFYYEFIDSVGGDFIEANKPILVAQYTPNFTACWKPGPNGIGGTYGDPEMFYLSPVEQGKKDVLFYCNKKANIDINYVQVIVPTAGLSSLKLDGLVFPIANTLTHTTNAAYSVAVAKINGVAGQHRLTCDSNFIGTMYGLGYYESYGYNIGCNINNLNTYGGVKNTLASSNFIDTISCPTTPLRLFVKLAYPATSMHWKLSQVPGLYPNTDSIINAPIPIGTEIINGRTYYIYTLQQDFTFANIGTYNIPVTYTTPDIGNCSNTENVSFEIKIKTGPVANFTFPSACPNQIITLTGASTANGFTLTNYLWNFPDVTTQATINATKSFPVIGSYPVRYRVYASNGCVGDTIKQVVIGSPLSTSVVGSGKACADSTFTFTSALVQDASNPRTWHWDFGDGTPNISTTTNSVTHSFSSSNVTRTLRHAVSFTVGCNTDTASFTVPIIAANPIANFSILKDTLCAGRAFAFASTNTNINTWLWNFGNGISNQVPPFTHTYSQAGNYNVQLVVNDNNGCGSLPAIDVMNINPIPVVNAGADVFVNPGNSILLQASVTPTANYNYLWTPGVTLSAANILQPVATPLATTTYNLFVKNPLTFCFNSDSVNVRIISKLYIPNAFSPISNAKNQVWHIPGIEQYPKATVAVYNRFGQKVYESNQNATNPWDGKFKGIAQPNGVYVYILNLNNATNDVLKGTIFLLR